MTQRQDDWLHVTVECFSLAIPLHLSTVCSYSFHLISQCLHFLVFLLRFILSLTCKETIFNHKILWKKRYILTTSTCMMTLTPTDIHQMIFVFSRTMHILLTNTTTTSVFSRGSVFTWLGPFTWSSFTLYSAILKETMFLYYTLDKHR